MNEYQITCWRGMLYKKIWYTLQVRKWYGPFHGSWHNVEPTMCKTYEEAEALMKKEKV